MWAVLGNRIACEKRLLFRKNKEKCYCTSVSSRFMYSLDHSGISSSDSQIIPFFLVSVKNEPMGLRCIVFCSFRKLPSLCIASCQCARHACFEATSSVQQLKEKNWEIKLSNVCSKHCCLHSTHHKHKK